MRAAMTVGTVLCLFAASAFANADNPAGGPGGTAKGPRPTVPAGMTDQLTPITDVPGTASAGRPAYDEPTPASGPVSVVAALRAMGAQDRAGIDIQVELPTAASAEMVALAREAEENWTAGNRQDAIERIAWLEESLGGIAVGTTPAANSNAGARGADTQIVFDLGVQNVELDYVPETGFLFSLVSSNNPRRWRLFLSQDGGATWDETYAWNSTMDMLDADMTIVDDYVYVVYLNQANGSETRVRRFHKSFGAADVTYNYQVVATAPAGQTPIEVATASNADTLDNRLYIASLFSGGEVDVRWTDAAAATTFNDFALNFMTGAAGLDLTTNPGYANRYLIASVIDTSDRVRVLARGSSTTWSNFNVAAYTGTEEITSISAFEDNVIVAYQSTLGGYHSIGYHISYDAGDTWSSATLATGSAGHHFQRPDVTARGGRGTAIVYTEEIGEPDVAYFQHRAGYQAGLWRPARVINDIDVQTQTPTKICWLGAAGLPPTSIDYGVIYCNWSAPYFDRMTLRPGDMNCDGEVNFADIDAFVLALSGEGLYSAQYPECDLMNGDLNCNGTLNFADIDAFVACVGGNCDCQ